MAEIARMWQLPLERRRACEPSQTELPVRGTSVSLIATSFATFPRGQQIAESFMNRLCGEALGKTGDYTCGPMLISAGLLHKTPPLPERLGRGWRFFLMAVARQLRMPMVLCPAGSQCRAAKPSEDDGTARDYRLRQLIENVTGLANGWTCLLDLPVPEAMAALEDCRLDETASQAAAMPFA
jgi:hypothetical protein